MFYTRSINVQALVDTPNSYLGVIPDLKGIKKYGQILVPIFKNYHVCFKHDLANENILQTNYVFLRKPSHV